ncbi:MAG: outer membrane beta-barrel protein [Flavobacteriales bacterium]|nr:outer membrane beta-barrel protein [Bacteroidota bacterium]MCB9241817.1 outer membrane beta-barrel protein [Flavobacteriales bacterium]
MNSNFEDILKSRLENLEIEAPALMDRIHAKRSGWYIFRNKLIIYRRAIMGAAALLLLIGGGIFWFNNQSTNMQVDQAGVENHRAGDQSRTQSGNVVENPSLIQQTQPLADGGNDATEFGHVSQPGAPSGATPSPSNFGGTPTHSNSNPGEPAYTNTGDQGGNHQPNIGETTNDANLSNESNQTNQSDQELAQGTNPSAKDDVNHTPVVKTEDGVDGESSNQPQVADLAKTTPDQTDDSDLQDEGHETTLPNTVPNRKWSVSIMGGPSMGYRWIDGDPNSDLVMLRNSSENKAVAFAASANLNYELNTHWELYSGLNWSNRRERVEYTLYNQSFNQQVTWKDVVQYDPLLPPQTIRLYDTTYESVEVQEQINHTNRYSRISVPIGARYTAYVNDRWGVFLNGDAALIVNSQFKGAVLRDDQTELNVSTPAYRRSTLGYSAGVGAGASYLIDPRVTLLGATRFNYVISPTTSGQYGLNQYDYTFSLMVGLKYHF